MPTALTRWWVLGALLLGCGTQTAPAAAQSGCELHKIAALPLTLDRHLPLVPVLLNGVHAWMGVDTGTQTTFVTAAAASRLGLPADPTRRTNVQSSAGVTPVQNVRLHDMQLGDVMLSDLSVAAVPMDQPDDARQRADGLIGSDILSDYDVELDFPARMLNLYAVSACGRVQPPWPGGFTTLRATLTPLRLLTVPVQLNGMPLTALFDTGSDRERITHAGAARAGVTDAMLAHDPGSTGYAAGGSTHVMVLHRFSNYRVGDEAFHAPLIEVTPLGGAGADMLLGLDYMRTRRFWLSYRGRVVFVQHMPP